MSKAARERAAMRRGGRKPHKPAQAPVSADQATRDWGAGDPEDEHQAPVPAGAGTVDEEGDGFAGEDEPAVATTTGNREELRLELRPRDMAFVRALSHAQGDRTLSQTVERLVRESARRYRPSQGGSMRLEEFDDSD